MSQMIAMAQVRLFVRVVNPKTAKILGNRFSGAILLCTDKVIE